MTITLNLPPETESWLKARAAQSNRDVESLIRDAIDGHFPIETRDLSELMAPVYEETRKSGMTDDEIDSFFANELRLHRSGS